MNLKKAEDHFIGLPEAIKDMSIVSCVRENINQIEWLCKETNRIAAAIKKAEPNGILKDWEPRQSSELFHALEAIQGSSVNYNPGGKIPVKIFLDCFIMNDYWYDQTQEDLNFTKEEMFTMISNLQNNLDALQTVMKSKLQEYQVAFCAVRNADIRILYNINNIFK